MLRSKLIKKVEELDKEMNDLFEKLGDYSHEALNTKPNEVTWSAIQVLQHLMLAEKMSTAYCVKKLSFKPKLKKANALSVVKSWLVAFALVLPIKFKAPDAVKVEKLPGEESLENILNQWVLQRKELREFVESIPDEYIDKEVYKHPFGLRLSNVGLLNFFKNHFNRHRKQILRRL